MKIDLEYKVFAEISMWSKCMPKPVRIDFEVPDLDVIADYCEEVQGLNKGDIGLKTRDVEIVFARQLAHATARVMIGKGAGWTLNEIGRKIGDKDHAIALNSTKRISNYIETKYRLREISNIAYHFDLDVDEYIYRPQANTRPVKIKITNANGEEKIIDSLVDTAAYLNTNVPRVFNYANSNKILKGYKITRYDN